MHTKQWLSTHTNTHTHSHALCVPPLLTTPHVWNIFNERERDKHMGCLGLLHNVVKVCCTTKSCEIWWCSCPPNCTCSGRCILRVALKCCFGKTARLLPSFWNQHNLVVACQMGDMLLHRHKLISMRSPFDVKGQKQRRGWGMPIECRTLLRWKRQCAQ